jgi:predicted anti-sigma-YlaC factor YlaD
MVPILSPFMFSVSKGWREYCPARSYLGGLGLAVVVLGSSPGCSVKGFAIKQLGSALAEGTGGAFAAEGDIEFAGQAIPFSLKLIESLLLEQPENPELLLASASGFTQYAYVWVEQRADFLEEEDFFAAQEQRARARAFYQRALGYANRGLEARYPGFGAEFRRDPSSAVARIGQADVALAYWAAAALGSAISLSKTEPEMIVRVPEVVALAHRALALQPDWNNGAILELLMELELSRPDASADAVDRVEGYFERVLVLTGRRTASPFVALAESVGVQTQDRERFVSLLNEALAIDPDAMPENRLANLVAQRRARWLLDRVEDLFL